MRSYLLFWHFLLNEFSFYYFFSSFSEQKLLNRNVQSADGRAQRSVAMAHDTYESNAPDANEWNAMDANDDAEFPFDDDK